MELPKFLLADSSQATDKMYVIHTEYPRFILDVTNDDIEWLDALEKEDGVELQVNELLELSYEFFDAEFAEYDDEEQAGV